MNQHIPVINKTLDLADCRDQWFFDEKYQVWCLEDILYTLKATTPKFQRMSIFVPAEYMNKNGTVNAEGTHGAYNAKTAPVVFANNSAGYMQMPHSWLGGPRDESGKYLKHGMVYVTCGSRGRDSIDADGRLCGKSPWILVDLKTAIRFLRHNRGQLPGNYDAMISVGWSAGGAMSSLLGVKGNSKRFDSFLEQNGAFMDEKDDVLAAQVYCPIIDLDHADLAYEWQFNRDVENEASPAGSAGVMTQFQQALSDQLMKDYINYFNELKLKNPENGSILILNEDGRSGSGYDYLMKCLEKSAAKYLLKLDRNELPAKFTSQDYLTGNYTEKVQASRLEKGSNDKDDLGLHHAGAAVMLPPGEDGKDRPGPDFAGSGMSPREKLSLGDLVSRPPKGVPYVEQEFPMIDVQGSDKTAWLSWDGEKAVITSLDDYILNHRRRMKPCTSFDTLGMDSGENQEFGTPENDYMRFSEYIGSAIGRLKDLFPDEYGRYFSSWANVAGDKELAERRYLINPMNYIGSDEKTSMAKHFRIRVGAKDADTAFTISMALALKLAEQDIDTDYALVWDLPHCEADYPGEICDWIDSIV
ncbi:hypothetical protein BCR32DRAFT_282228 [Anaeromyces robustus]|uniref:BD-FAE-like domain-containing protein n=1 Tax=Anaeromyces robustus TaxID=1754192 RepID=A0A1Y1WYI6_9FUNG|nr:hypothetical protein BCR32DRAFT_282228 [Anaeromyces robustus]|eukprot:ORX78482.1 hypothetical protein BCR32DRAFT_282228 [Anaeromyces robustus]